MLPGEEGLRDELIALNLDGGALLRWDVLRNIARRARVDASTRKELSGSAAGQKLLKRIERAIERNAKKKALVFLAHGFHKRDAPLVQALREHLKAKGIRPVTGEKPAPRSVSAKVLDRIDSTRVFVALFTINPDTGRASPWVVSELGYAARYPRVVLLESPLDQREIGGIQGDVEYIGFSRKAFQSAFKRAAESASEPSS